MKKIDYQVKILGIERSRVLIFLSLPLLAPLFFGGVGHARGLLYSGSYAWEENEADRIVQSQNHNVSLGLSHKPTDRLSINEYIRYSISDGDLTAKQETVYQGVGLSLRNPLVSTQLNAVSTLFLSEGSDRDNEQQIQFGTASNWGNDLVPALSLSAGINSAQFKGSEGDGDTESESRFAQIGVDWRRGALGLLYDFGWQDASPRGGQHERTNSNHSAELTYSGTYWQRVTFSLKQRLMRTSSEMQISGLAGLSLIPANIAEVRTGPDDPADDFDDSSLTINNAMDDGNLAVPAYNVASNSDANNILMVLNGVEVDLIYLYTETDLGSAAPTGLTWTMFTNSILGTSWGQISLPAGAITYNRAERRFEIDVGGIGADYLKLVLDVSLLGPEIRFTEVRAIERFSSLSGETRTGSETEDSSTVVGISTVITEHWLFSYNLNFAKTASETSPVRERETEELGQTGSLQFKSQDGSFRTNFSLSENSKEADSDDGTSERRLRIYGVNLDKVFLPTLQAGLGVHGSEEYADTELKSEGLSVRFNSSAILYPDLNMDFQLGYAETTNVESSTESESHSAHLSLVSRLRPSATLSLTESYSGGDSPDAFNTSITYSWQISRAISFNGGAAYQTGQEDVFNIDGSLNLGLTDNILLKISYSRQSGEATLESGSAKIYWHPLGKVRFEGGCDYTNNPQAAPSRDVRVYGRVAVNFAIP